MVKIIDRNNLPEIPESVAVCPICEAKLIIEDIDEWQTDTGRVTEGGFHITCSTQPDFDEEIYISRDFSEWDDWWDWHFHMPYVDWLPIQTKVYRWFDARFRWDSI